MPRASWNGFLRLSLVSCPVYLSPATQREKTTRLNYISPDTGSKIETKAVDRETGATLERSELNKGYEFERGQFVEITKEELKALDVESTKIIDLTQFVPAGDLDPLYFSTPYFVYPEGKVGTEAYGVIKAAMSEAGVVGIGRVTLTKRERQVVVLPHGAGLSLWTLRAAEEVRTADFKETGEAEEEAIAIAKMIIGRKQAAFDPSAFVDRYQEALRELIDKKVAGLQITAPTAQTVAGPASTVDLMAALKASLANENTPADARKAPAKKTKVDPRQRSILLPVTGGAVDLPAKAKTRKPGDSILVPAPVAVEEPAPKRKRKGAA